MKVIISAGGTGGHIYPALAIMDIIKKMDPQVEFLYIGTHNRMEKEIIPKKGIKYEELKIYGFNKKKVIKNIENIVLINKAFKKCKKIMKEFKPDLVVGAGGYVTYPVIKTAQKLGIKTFIHEQNSFSGKTNVALGKKADLIGVSFEKSMKDYKNCKGKVFMMGNPCVKRALSISPIKKSTLGFNDELPLIVVVAGSLGSSSINRSFKEILKKASEKKYQVLFVTGAKLYDSFISDVGKLSDNVKILPYVENLPGLLKNTDVLISRAGASTMSEVIALNVPTIFIPSPYVANNHQYYNALDLVEKKAALMIEEKNLSTEVVLNTIDKLLKENKEIKQNLKNIPMIDSEGVFISEVRKILNVK